MTYFLTDEEIEACLRALAEFVATLPEKDAQIIQRGIRAVEQVAHRRGLEDAAKTLDALAKLRYPRANSQKKKPRPGGTGLPKQGSVVSAFVQNRAANPPCSASTKVLCCCNPEGTSARKDPRLWI